MDLTTTFNQPQTCTIHTTAFTQSKQLSGITTQLLHQGQPIGEATVYLAPEGLSDEALLTYLDEIELLAVELFDVAQDQKRIAKQIKQHPFAYLTNLTIHPDYQNLGLGSLLLNNIVTTLEEKQIPNLYLVSVANTSREQQKLHHFYTHHYFTYLMPNHPAKPAVMHRAI